MAGNQQTINATHFQELLKSVREQSDHHEIRRQLRAGTSATDVARVVAESAGKFAGSLPPPAGVALQSVLFLAEFGLQALENTVEAASLREQLRDVEQYLRSLEHLGSVSDDVQQQIDHITAKLLQVSVLVDDLDRRPPSGWRKCTSCLRDLVCAKCDAQEIKGVGNILGTVLSGISLTLNRIAAQRIGRPAEAAPELPAHVDMGMHQRLSKVMEFLRMNTSTNQTVRVVGLHGEAGIGKTTLMYAVHDQLTRDTVPQQRVHKIATIEVGMTPPPPMTPLFKQLQESLYSQLSGGAKLGIATAAQGRSELRDLLTKLGLGNKPVCILLDNVWEPHHLEELLPHNLADVIPSGSYMVITSRSAKVVRKLAQMCFKSKEEEMQGYLPYQLGLLDEEDAVMLFLKNASRGEESRPLSKEDALVKAVVPLCGGLPLALAVYGGHFKDESRRKPVVWEGVCKKLKEAQDLLSERDRVFYKLKQSIEFQSKELQDAFLDMALFFNRKDCSFDLDTIKYALQEEDYLELLVEQSLVRVRGITRQLVVHDLFVLIAQQMAKERSIAFAPISEHDPTLPDQMQVRYFDVQAWPPNANYPSPSQMKGCRYLILKGLPSRDPKDFHGGFFGPTITKHCHNIRLLELGKDFLDEPDFMKHVFPWIANLKELTVLFLSGATTFHIASTPKICFKLRLFSFEGSSHLSDGVFDFPKSFLDSSFTTLRRLSMHGRTLAQLPPEIGKFTSLTVLDLDISRSLMQLPLEIRQLISLMELKLSGCISLVQLPSEIWQLTSLTKLALSKCASLVHLPSEIKQLTSLTALGLSGWASLVQLPLEIGQLTSLTNLDLSHCTNLIHLPSVIGHLASMIVLDLSNCTSLAQLPLEIGKLNSLTTLTLSSCRSLSQLPREIGRLTSLTVLTLYNCASLIQLPSEIGKLVSLRVLGLSGCDSLKELSPEIGQLTSLMKLYVSECMSLVKLPSTIGHLISLTDLDLSGCTSMVQLLPEIRQLTSLTWLNLSKLRSLTKLPPEITQLISLTDLHLHNCTSLVQISPEIGQLTSLTDLHLYNCMSLAQLPQEIGELTSLMKLDLFNCTSLVHLPPEIGQLISLTMLDLSYCTNLVQLPPEIGQLASLTTLHLAHCISLVQLPPEIGQLSSLRALDLSGCASLTHLPLEIKKLASMIELNLTDCVNLV